MAEKTTDREVNYMGDKKKVLIVIDNMKTGGIATSLYNFLHFTHDEIECDLLVFDKESVDRTKLPVGISIIDSPRWLNVLGLSQKEVQEVSMSLSLLRLVLIFLSRLISGEFARAILFTFMRKYKGYDFAISYAQDNGWKSLSKGCNDLVIKKVEASRKIAFVHCDYANYGGYDSRQEKMLSRFHSIACVSNSCKQSFITMFPRLAEQCTVCGNFTNILEIKEKSIPAIEYPDDVISFVTVCRLSTVKGLERTIQAFSELYRTGYQNFYWVIVGDGPERQQLEKLAIECDICNQIVFEGEKRNPYPYIKNADVFLLPSLHEAAPMVFGESAALGVPILSTQTCSAVEMVQERNWGIVVENDMDGIKEGIKMILENPSVLRECDIHEEDINKEPVREVHDLFAKASKAQ